MSFRIATVSLARNPEKPTQNPDGHILNMLGQNSGNLMFTEAMFQLFDADVERIGFRFSPDMINSNFDAVVIPAANWLNANADWDLLTEQVEKLSVPVVLIGIGLQANSRTLQDVRVSDSAIRFVRLLSERSPYISVRGDFTRTWLESIGIRNAVTTGCPSLFMNVFKTERQPDERRFALQGTRYSASAAFNNKRSAEKHIFASAARLKMPIIYQSESEESRRLLVGQPVASHAAPVVSALLDLYGVSSADELDTFVDEYGKIFFNLFTWSDFVAGLYGVVGSRLHGTIIALNTGVRALLYGHDSRTQEVIEYAALPGISKSRILSLRTVDDYLSALNDAPIEMYYDRRAENQAKFQQFLRNVGLPYRPEAMF